MGNRCCSCRKRNDGERPLIQKTKCAAHDCPLTCALSIENVPILGHLLAAVYSCCNQRSRAERAGLKATVGIVLGIINCPVEFFDEVGRKRSPKLPSVGLTMRPDWMKLYQHKTIRELCLPGSHQSGSYCTHHKLKQVPMVEGWSRCQDHNIHRQLHGGIRFFDLRLMSNEQGEIWLHHNVIACVELSQVLWTIKDFVEEYPSEVIGIYITNDGKHLDWKKCHETVSHYLGPQLIQERLRNVPIGELVKKGRNIFIAGVPNMAYSWHQFTYRWPNMAWPHMIASDMNDIIQEMGNKRPYSLYWYKAEATPTAGLVARSIGGLPGVCAQGCADEKFEFLEDLASAVNYQVCETLEQTAYIPFNIISTDFVQDDIVGRIIELNEEAHVAVTLALEPSLAEEKIEGEVMPDDLIENGVPNSPGYLEVWESNV